MPFIYINWIVGESFMLNGLLPTNLNALYRFNKILNAGITFKVVGNRYHGDPDKFGVDNPQLEIYDITLGALFMVHFSKWVHLNAEGGYSLYRRFEFFDGADKISTLTAGRTWYVNAGITVGI